MVKHSFGQIIRQILLFDIVAWKVMGILISGSVPQLLGAFIVFILEMDRHRHDLFAFYRLHSLPDSGYHRIAFGGCGHIDHCLSQNDLRFRHPHPLHGLGSGFQHL